MPKTARKMDEINCLVYERGKYWAKKVPKGYEVYRLGFTRSVRCAVIGWQGEEGLDKAIAEIGRRIEKDQEKGR